MQLWAVCHLPLCACTAFLGSSLLPVWLQFGLLDHVSAWPLSPGEPLGALHNALLLLDAWCACHSLALAEQHFWGMALSP